MKATKPALVVILVLAIGSLAFWFGPQKEMPPAQMAPAVSAPNLRPTAAFPMVFRSLSQSLQGWGQADRADQVNSVRAIIETFKNRLNIAILNTPEFYTDKITEMLRGNQVMVNMPLQQVITILSIMEYDYYNGENKDVLARKILGEKMFEANQKRRQALAARK